MLLEFPFGPGRSICEDSKQSRGFFFSRQRREIGSFEVPCCFVSLFFAKTVEIKHFFASQGQRSPLNALNS